MVNLSTIKEQEYTMEKRQSLQLSGTGKTGSLHVKQ